MKKIILFVLLVAASMSMLAQSGKITGHIFDENGDPLPFVNVALVSASDSTFVDGAMSSEDGAFTLKAGNAESIIKASYIGYHTEYIKVSSDTLSFSMTPDALFLEGAVVKASVPVTRVKGDAMQTLVSGSVLEKAGSTADLLNKIPSLSTDNDGKVSVFGRGDAEVYVNGRKLQDTKELSLIRAEQVQSVEVVHNPGARYSASTKAVVRIILKKAKGEGVSFIEDAMVSYSYKVSATNNFSLNYRTGGLDVTTSLWGGSYGGRSLQENVLSYMVGNDVVKGVSTQDQPNRFDGISPQIQFNYQVNENHSFGAFYKYDNNLRTRMWGLMNTDSYMNDVFYEHSESDMALDRNSAKHIANMYYNGHAGKLSIDFNADVLFDRHRDLTTTSELTRDAEDTEESHYVENLTRNGNNFVATKLVLSYPVWKGNLSIGGEYSYNHRTDIYTYSSPQTLPVKATDDAINESSGAAFVEFGRPFGKFYIQAGLRYEHIANNYYSFGKRDMDMSRSYGDFFPTVNMSFPIKSVQVSLSYRRDIKRPSFHDLTNSTFYINRYTYQQGNPYLTPTYTHSVVANLSYKTFGVSVNYANIKDVVSLVTKPFPGSEDPLVSLISPENSKHRYNRGVISTYFMPTIGCWHPRWVAALAAQDFQSYDMRGQLVKMNKALAQCSWDNDFTFPKDWRLNAALAFTSKGDYDNYRMTKCVFNTSLGVQKDINMKKAGLLTLELSASDLCFTASSAAVVYGPRELYAYNPARIYVQFHAVWKFNSADNKYRGTGAGGSQKSRM